MKLIPGYVYKYTFTDKDSLLFKVVGCIDEEGRYFGEAITSDNDSLWEPGDHFSVMKSELKQCSITPEYKIIGDFSQWLNS